MAFFNETTSRERHFCRGASSFMGGGTTAACLTAGILSAIPFAGWVALAVIGTIATVSLLGYSVFNFFKAYKGGHQVPSDSRYEEIYQAAGGRPSKK